MAAVRPAAVVRPTIGDKESVTTMKRREFLKLSGIGGGALFLSGCGISALGEDKKTTNTVKGSVSGGNIMKTLFLQDEDNKRWAYELRADGRTEGIFYSLKNLMNKLGYTLDKVMDTLDVSIKEREIYKQAMVT